MYNLHKPLQGIRSRIVRLLGLKHHVILVLFSGQLRPLVADFGFFLRFIVVQVVALGLYHQNLSTVEHHDDVAIWAHPVRKFDAFIIPDTGIQNNRFSHLNTKISNSNLSVSKAFRSPFPSRC